MQYQLIQSQMKGSKVKGLSKINNLVLALQSGKVSGLVMEELTAKAYAQNNKSLLAIKSNLKVAQEGNAVALAKGQSDLLKAVNKTIKRVQKKKIWFIRNTCQKQPKICRQVKKIQYVY